MDKDQMIINYWELCSQDVVYKVNEKDCVLVRYSQMLNMKMIGEIWIIQ